MVELFSMQSARRIGVAWNGRPTGPGVDLGSCVDEITLWTSSKCLQLDIEVLITINGETMNLQIVQCYDCIRLSIPGYSSATLQYP